MLLIVIAALTGQPHAATLEEQASTPRAGDILLRSGSSVWAALARKFAIQEPRWVHSGILIETPDGLRVMHMDGSPMGGRLVIESMEDFIGEHDATLVRPDLDESALENLTRWLEVTAAREIPFDTRFDLKEDQAYYCTELIWRAVKDATGKDPLPVKPAIAQRSYIPVDLLLDLGHHLPLP